MSKKNPNKKGFFKEFVEFINKGNALALAIGVILGGAFTAIVTAINQNIISPIIAAIIGDGKLNESLITVLKYKDAAQADIDAGIASTIGEQIPSIYISWGALIQAIIDFLLIALILFLIIKITTAVFNSAKKANTEIIAIQEILMSLEISIPLNAEYILANLNNDTSSNCSFVISNSSILTVFAYFSKYSL